MTFRRHLRAVGTLVAFTALGSLTLRSLPLQAEDTGTQPYDDSFYGDEYAGDNDEYNYGDFGYDDWDSAYEDDDSYDYPYTTTDATSGGNNDAWWENSPYYNEDEWYDPTGWFDGNNYEYDSSDDSSRYDSSYANDREDN